MPDMKEKGYTHTHTLTTHNFSVSPSPRDCVYAIPKRERCSRVSYFFHSNTFALCPWVHKQKTNRISALLNNTESMRRATKKFLTGGKRQISF